MKKLWITIMILTLGIFLVSCKEDPVDDPIDDPIVDPTEEIDYQVIVDAAKSLVPNGLDSNEVSEDYFMLPAKFDFVHDSKTYEIKLSNWTSDSQEIEIFESTAVVNRPKAGEDDVEVTLSVTLELKAKTTIQTFKIKVVAFPVWEVTYDLPDTAALEDETNPFVVEDAPDLLILGVVLDTVHFYHYETMSGFEYIKVYNNTNQPYNMKNHRITLANPMQGQNFENEDSKVGNKALSTGYLFYSLIDEDFILDPLSTGLIWLQPYFWVAGSGTGAYNKDFSTMLVHTDSDEKLGAFNQTMTHFREFWGLDETTKVYEATNMPIMGKREEGGTSEFFPIITPGGGTGYTHLNSVLLRSLEIAKFNDQDGKASISILNKYDDMSESERENPPLIAGKQIFNTIEIKEEGELVDGYLHTNTWKYFDPIIRANFTGRINLDTIDTSGKVDFLGTSNPGVLPWENTTELQFRPPLKGERIMQLQLMVREYATMERYLNSQQFSIMRYSPVNVSAYKMVPKTIILTVDPTLEGVVIHYRTDEIRSEGRLSGAAPTKIKVINLLRP